MASHCSVVVSHRYVSAYGSSFHTDTVVAALRTADRKCPAERHNSVFVPA